MEDSNDMMAIDSLNTSSAASTLSNASVITVTENFQKRYTEIDSKKLPLHELVSHAECFIDELGSEQGKDEIGYRGEKFQAHGVLRAMHEHAEGCGGEYGKRYTATAICACVKDKQDGEETLDALHDLAATWVSHFLFIFKCRGHVQQLDKMPSEIATPTDSGIGTPTEMGTPTDSTIGTPTEMGTPTEIGTPTLDEDKSNLRDEVLRRDGYRCVVSKLIDFNHPEYKHSKQLGVPRHQLEVCHILHPPAVFEPNRRHPSYLSAAATSNILHNYTSLPDGITSNLEGVIVHPSNAFSLQGDRQIGFDEFEWCLIPTEVL
ncbi:hypothetical protein M378DRAFT_160219 [Amanita muscaria Koide BX008]|uniref:HNH nuclease domain-containing protein n=1 Tax=Amanita muscaria (strain Koide BX008) TaxID=946122 RepID=A0A0C2XD30_AMAMK|nr:hypothetical protein M378DRAFT_160219 [Amanita muscaria Koide BX008]